LGAHVIECSDYHSLVDALKEAKTIDKTTVIYTTCDRYQGVEGYGWWEVPIAEVSEMETVNKAQKENLQYKKKQRFHH
jgi:3D-(3,5/4)-trihydroxycyclohexane-1,2-dione acylhydrolase (decyclizing)